MKTDTHRFGDSITDYRSLITVFLLTLSLLLPLTPAQAYPPAPDHIIYGQVRDEVGNPIDINGAEVILQTQSGVVIRSEIVAGLDPGVNYRLKIPMDAGISSKLYRPTALHPTVPFKIHVKIERTVYLPIEMVVDYAQLGQPSEKTLLNLTLGEDSDGDGIPDAWERALLGPGQTINDINPGDDADGDGMSNLNEYLTGNYAYDKGSEFALTVAGFSEGNPMLEFTAVRGRTYTVLGSENLGQWSTVQFQLENDTTEGQPAYSAYYAPDIRKVRIIVAPGDASPRYFRLMVR